MSKRRTYTGGVYIIHLDTPYKHAKHYVGYSTNVDARLDVHWHGGAGASRLLQVCKHAGITFDCVRVWPNGTRAFESWIKNRYKRTTQLCPVCNPTGPLGADKVITTLPRSYLRSTQDTLPF